MVTISTEEQRTALLIRTFKLICERLKPEFLSLDIRCRFDQGVFWIIGSRVGIDKKMLVSVSLTFADGEQKGFDGVGNTVMCTITPAVPQTLLTEVQREIDTYKRAIGAQYVSTSRYSP